MGNLFSDKNKDALKRALVGAKKRDTIKARQKTMSDAKLTATRRTKAKDPGFRLKGKPQDKTFTRVASGSKDLVVRPNTVPKVVSTTAKESKGILGRFLGSLSKFIGPAVGAGSIFMQEELGGGEEAAMEKSLATISEENRKARLQAESSAANPMAGKVELPTKTAETPKPAQLSKKAEEKAKPISPEKSEGLSNTFAQALGGALPVLLGAALGGSEGAVEVGEQFKKQREAAAKQERDIELLEVQNRMKDERLNKQLRAKKEIALLKDQGVDKKDLERYVPGVGFALTKDDAKGAKTVIDSTDNALKTLNAIMELREEQGGELLNRPAVRKGKNLAKQLQLILKGEEFAKLGVLAGPDMAILEEIMPADPLEFSPTGATDQALKEVHKMITRKAKAYFESRGLNLPTHLQANPKYDPEARKSRIEELRAKRGN